MARTIQMLEVRKQKLLGRNNGITIDNSKIIAKLDREIRRMKEDN
jgi:hypothetical protein